MYPWLIQYQHSRAGFDLQTTLAMTFSVSGYAISESLWTLAFHLDPKTARQGQEGCQTNCITRFPFSSLAASADVAGFSYEGIAKSAAPPPPCSPPSFVLPTAESVKIQIRLLSDNYGRCLKLECEHEQRRSCCHPGQPAKSHPDETWAPGAGASDQRSDRLSCVWHEEESQAKGSHWSGSDGHGKGGRLYCR